MALIKGCGVVTHVSILCTEDANGDDNNDSTRLSVAMKTGVRETRGEEDKLAFGTGIGVGGGSEGTQSKGDEGFTHEKAES